MADFYEMMGLGLTAFGQMSGLSSPEKRAEPEPQQDYPFAWALPASQQKTSPSRQVVAHQPAERQTETDWTRLWSSPSAWMASWIWPLPPAWQPQTPDSPFEQAWERSWQQLWETFSPSSKAPQPSWFSPQQQTAWPSFDWFSGSSPTLPALNSAWPSVWPAAWWMPASQPQTPSGLPQASSMLPQAWTQFWASPLAVSALSSWMSFWQLFWSNSAWSNSPFSSSPWMTALMSSSALSPVSPFGWPTASQPATWWQQTSQQNWPSAWATHWPSGQPGFSPFALAWPPELFSAWWRRP